MTAEVEMTQADREAAADYIDGELAYRTSRARLIREGYSDSDSTVQAFARHRIASTIPKDEAIDELVGALREAADFIQPFNRAEELSDRLEALIAKHGKVKP